MSTYWNRIAADGLVAGLIGFAGAAVFLAASNALIGRSPFYVPALLGGFLFYGLRDPAAVPIWAGPVLAFNGFQLAVFLIIGLASAWIAAGSERHPQLWFVGIVAFLIGWIHLYMFVLWIAGPIESALPFWMITGASLVAASLMLVYLWIRHPTLRHAIRTEKGAPGELEQ